MGRSGIGQLVRLTRLAEQLASSRMVNVRVRVLTAVPDAERMFSSPRVEVATLPSAWRYCDWRSRYPSGSTGDTLADAVYRCVEDFQPQIFLTSHHIGLNGDLEPALRLLKRLGIECVLILRDIYDQRDFSRYGGPTLEQVVNEFYAGIVVCGTRLTAQHLPPRAGAHSVSFAGYVTPPYPVPRLSPASDIDFGQYRVLCHVGGGTDSDALHRTLEGFLRFRRRCGGVSPSLDLVTGPLSGSLDLAVTRRRLPSGVRWRRWVRHVDSYDCRITMAGYNSCVEAALWHRPTLLMPRLRDRDPEQSIRAALFESLFPRISVDHGTDSDTVDAYLEAGLEFVYSSRSPNISTDGHGIMASAQSLRKLLLGECDNANGERRGRATC
jgi:predicted glycosyltransferase